MPDVQSPSIGPGPIQRDDRIASIDVLRGVAVLGILPLNMQSFAMPGAAYMNPTAYGDLEGANYWVWYCTHLLGDLKFWSIFSMLFGAGIILMATRCEATGRSPAGVHYRRMGWLLLFGLLHAHLLWYGDVLYNYALCGMVLYLFRKWSARALLALAAIPLLIDCAVSIGFGWLLVSADVPEMRAEMSAAWRPTAEQIQAELEIYRSGWLQQQPHRMSAAFFFETFLFFFTLGWRSAGMMLIGMALYKLEVFSARRSWRFYVTLLAIGLLVGLPVIAYGIHRNESAGWSLEYSFNFGPLYNYWGSILVALGWTGLVMLVCQAGGLRSATRPFAAAGRMALTCYLLQSIIATTIFYGHGWGRFGHFERWQQLWTVVAIWTFLLVFASIWLRSFRYGPFEWLWRSLTYLKWQPMTVQPANVE